MHFTEYKSVKCKNEKAPGKTPGVLAGPLTQTPYTLAYTP